MNADLHVPPMLLAYARFHGLDPLELAQNALDELERDFGELLLRRWSPWSDLDEPSADSRFQEGGAN